MFLIGHNLLQHILSVGINAWTSCKRKKKKMLTWVKTFDDGRCVYEISPAQDAHEVRVELGNLYPGCPMHLVGGWTTTAAWKKTQQTEGGDKVKTIWRRRLLFVRLRNKQRGRSVGDRLIVCSSATPPGTQWIIIINQSIPPIDGAPPTNEPLIRKISLLRKRFSNNLKRCADLRFAKKKWTVILVWILEIKPSFRKPLISQLNKSDRCRR